MTPQELEQWENTQRPWTVYLVEVFDRISKRNGAIKSGITHFKDALDRFPPEKYPWFEFRLVHSFMKYGTKIEIASGYEKPFQRAYVKNFWGEQFYDDMKGTRDFNINGITELVVVHEQNTYDDIIVPGTNKVIPSYLAAFRDFKNLERGITPPSKNRYRCKLHESLTWEEFQRANS